MELFRGFESAHGQYRVNSKEADGKSPSDPVSIDA